MPHKLRRTDAVVCHHPAARENQQEPKTARVVGPLSASRIPIANKEDGWSIPCSAFAEHELSNLPRDTGKPRRAPRTARCCCRMKNPVQPNRDRQKVAPILWKLFLKPTA